MSDEPMQLDLLGGETPLDRLPLGTRCTNDENCRAEADEHETDCPKEAELKATFGF